MKKALFDYEKGENLEVESKDTHETLEVKIKKDLKARRKIILGVLVVGLLIFLVDAGIHHKSYSWYDWASDLTQDEVTLASSVAARYQLSDAIVQYSTDKDTVRIYKVERHCAKEELRDLGYRGDIPSKDWPELN